MARYSTKAASEAEVLDRIARTLAEAHDAATLPTAYAALAEEYRGLVERLYKIMAISDGYQAQIKDLASELDQMTGKLRRLQDVALPICVRCHKVHAGDAYWQRLETYLIENLDILFSLGLCPECLAETRERLGEGKTARSVLPDRPHIKALPKLAEDKVARELEALAQRAAQDGSPLAPEIAKAAKDCGKLAHRFAKTITISDSFHSQLRELNTRLELMARTDLLTGLANRWEMASRIEIERGRAERHGTTVSLILGDLDHFKAVNDTFGHLAGDCVLRTVAEALRSHVRREDICARWGGEEFLILLPETDANRAKCVAEKLGRIVREREIDFEGRAITVSMSFGVGELSAGLSLDGGLKLVDDALYAAKSSGRDRVVAVEELSQP